jgi:hypothetical protein
MTREGVGDTGETGSTEGKGESWSSCWGGVPFRDALAAPARVVTMASSRESCENCSADMKTE